MFTRVPSMSKSQRWRMLPQDRAAAFKFAVISATAAAFLLSALSEATSIAVAPKTPLPNHKLYKHRLYRERNKPRRGITMAKTKPHINLVFIGHVDHGKSTTVGRLFFDSGNVDEQTMRKLKQRAEELGKKGFEFAFVMDNLKEEQERGVTIDLSHKRFDTQKYYFTIIDAPGHKDFIKNMITGASQADAAVLVVAANDGVNAQTIEHLKLSKIFGVGQLV